MTAVASPGRPTAADAATAATGVGGAGRRVDAPSAAADAAGGAGTGLDRSAGDGARLTRDTATISAMTALSRVTGFARIFVLGAVVGRTALGDTYQTTNSVPNLVFELFAAGVLQAVLVPELVEAVSRRGRDEGRRLAGAALGALLAVLAVATVVGVVLAPLLARALFAGADADLRADQVWLATVFLWVFLPQVLFYAGGMVATAALNADDRFAVPAFAPVLNNVVVIAAYVAFWALLGSKAPSLDLSPVEVAALAGGTTLGVATFTSAPVIAAVRRGLLARPRLTPRDPDVRRMARRGVWAGLFMALTQVLLVAALVCGATIEGGAVVYQFGYTYFLLPHALVAIPVFTALYPSLSRAAQADDRSGYDSLLRRAVQAVWVLVLPAAVAMVVLGVPIARLTLFGASASAVEPVAHTMAAFAPGLAPYGLFLLLTRASYAQGDARLPTVVHLAATGVGVAGMAVATATLDGDGRVVGLAVAHSLAYIVAVAALAASLRATGRVGPLARWRTVAGASLAALGCAAAMVAIRLSGLGGDGRMGALVQVAAAGAVGLAAYVAGLHVTGVGDPRRLLQRDPAGRDPAGRGAAGGGGGVGAVDGDA